MDRSGREEIIQKGNGRVGPVGGGALKGFRANALHPLNERKPPTKWLVGVVGKNNRVGKNVRGEIDYQNDVGLKYLHFLKLSRPFRHLAMCLKIIRHFKHLKLRHLEHCGENDRKHDKGQYFTGILRQRVGFTRQQII